MLPQLAHKWNHKRSGPWLSQLSQQTLDSFQIKQVCSISTDTLAQMKAFSGSESSESGELVQSVSQGSELFRMKDLILQIHSTNTLLSKLPCFRQTLFLLGDMVYLQTNSWKANNSRHLLSSPSMQIWASQYQHSNFPLFCGEKVS